MSARAEELEHRRQRIIAARRADPELSPGIIAKRVGVKQDTAVRVLRVAGLYPLGNGRLTKSKKGTS